MNIELLLKDYQRYHSEFQIDNFIVGNAGDNWASYKQCLREIKTRKQEIKINKQKIELAGLEYKALKRKRFFKFTKYSRLKIKFAIENGKENLFEMREDLRDIERELDRFVKIAFKLKKQIGDLNFEKRAALESNSWLNKARFLSLIDSITNHGQPSRATVEFIFALPNHLQQIIFSEIAENGKKIDHRTSDQRTIGNRSQTKSNDV